MATLNNNMTITNTALTHVSKELINKREFDNTSVVVVGSPSIINGIAGSFSSTSYYLKEGLDFTSAEEIALNIKCTYIESTQDQVLFVLSDGQSLTDLKVVINSSSVKLLNGSTEILSINATLKNEDEVNLKLSMTSVSTELILFVNDVVYQSVVSGQFGDIINRVLSLYIGSDPLNSELYWEGTINLKELIVFVNEKEYYSTGILRGYTFTKLLVSDGTIQLEDSSYEILGHVVECPVEEIVKTDNNILLKATIGSGVSLNIVQAGLYCNDGEKDILFSLIDSLSIKKGTDLGYSLILHVKLDINVVNTSVTPDIEVLEDDSVSMASFEIVKRDHTFITSNLERMIKDNSLGLGNYKCYLDIRTPEDTRVNADGTESLANRTMTDVKPSGIGYNKPQSNYKVQSNINELQDAYSASLGYSKIEKRGSIYINSYFSEENIEKKGAVLVNSKGEASVFSEVDYVKADLRTNDVSTFDFTVAFEAETTLSSSGTICCLQANSSVQPLIVSLNNDMIHLSLGQQEKAVITVDGVSATYKRGKTSTSSGATYYWWTYGGPLDTASVVLTKDLTPTASSTLYNRDLEVISGTVKTFVSGTIIDEDLVKATTGIKQYVRVTFDGNYYKVYVKKEGEDFILFDTKMSPLLIENPASALFGIGYSGQTYSNHFYGTIYLAEFNFTDTTSTLSFVETEEIGTTVLQDYYHIPVSAKSYYNAYNLNHYSDEYTINIQEGLLEGRKDDIDLENEDGFSLCIKAKLEDSTDKIVLTKSNPEASIGYFTFQVKDSIILFTIYAKDQTITLSKKLNVSNFRRYLNYEALFTVICSKASNNRVSYTFYMNRELLDSKSGEPLSFDSGNYRLTNYLEDRTDAETNYVSDIISFVGELSEGDLFYLCNTLDTNF